MHIFDLTRILRRGCRHQAGHRESVFVSVGIREADMNEPCRHVAFVPKAAVAPFRVIAKLR
jgi:hypothetical protein